MTSAEATFAVTESDATWERVATARNRRDRGELSLQNARKRLEVAERAAQDALDRADVALLHGADGLPSRFRRASGTSPPKTSRGWPVSTRS